MKESVLSKRLTLIAVMWAALVGANAGSVDAQSEVQFVLTGVMLVEGGAGRAWLREPTLTQNQVITTRPGDQIGPYRLKKILADRVELEGPGGTFLVRLSGSSEAPTVAPKQKVEPEL